MNIRYIGQCGFIIEGSRKIAIDPVLNDLLDDDGNTIRLYPPVMAPEDLKADYVFCTHDHIDHLAEPTIFAIAKSNSKTKFVVPNGCVNTLITGGVRSDRIIGVGDKKTIELDDGIIIRGISTAHPVHQVDEVGKDHNLAYAITMDGKQILHLGDTYITDRLMFAIKKLGQIDLFFPPINGRDEKREAEGIIGNLFPEEAVDIIEAADIKTTIPTHFDMIKGNTEDPKRFEEAFKARNINGQYFIPTLEGEITL